MYTCTCTGVCVCSVCSNAVASRSPVPHRRPLKLRVHGCLPAPARVGTPSAACSSPRIAASPTAHQSLAPHLHPPRAGRAGGSTAGLGAPPSCRAEALRAERTLARCKCSAMCSRGCRGYGSRERQRCAHARCGRGRLEEVARRQRA